MSYLRKANEGASYLTHRDGRERGREGGREGAGCELCKPAQAGGGGGDGAVLPDDAGG